MSKDMISVPRELLEMATRISRKPPDEKISREAQKQLRALLAQPNTCTKDGGQCEPVAWYDRNEMQRMESGGVASILVAGKKQQFYNAPLYSDPPAPAPVVLPERKQWGGLLPTAENLKTDGWNACLDEFKRLNPAL
ncbi:hypothetical protein LZ023_26835 [Pseudomonas silvicola]|nr:hypothetical protein LZ023_26835 [Pseudomonas silvicola]